MSGHSLETAHLFYDRYNRGDLDGTMELFAADARHDNRVLGLTFEGRDAIRGFFDDYAEIVEEATAVPTAFATEGDLVIVTVDLGGRLRHTGLTEATIPTEVVHGFTFRGQEIAWWTICSSQTEALRAAGRLD